jgi:hypothetical protein
MAVLAQPGSGRGRRRASAIVALALFASAGRALAADFGRLDVSEDAGTYRIRASLFIDAPPEAVVGALLDFDGQNAIAPPIVEIREVGTTPDGGKLVKVVSEICIGPFCKDVKQLQVVRLTSPGAVSAMVIPGAGDLASGATEIEVSADGGRARVRMDCTIRPLRRRPRFLPGGWVLNAIRRQARQSAAGLEALAQRIAARTRGASRGLER